MRGSILNLNPNIAYSGSTHYENFVNEKELTLFLDNDHDIIYVDNFSLTNSSATFINYSTSSTSISKPLLCAWFQRSR